MNKRIKKKHGINNSKKIFIGKDIQNLLNDLGDRIRSYKFDSVKEEDYVSLLKHNIASELGISEDRVAVTDMGDHIYHINIIIPEEGSMVSIYDTKKS